VREAFRWSVMRRVTKTATVSLYANRYEVDPGLVGRNVELRFDPEDLSVIDVVTNGVTICQAAPFKIGRHVHPSVKKEEPGQSANKTVRSSTTSGSSASPTTRPRARAG